MSWPKQFRPAPNGVNADMPNAARLWNYLLGGKDHYEVDRAAARKILEIAPDTRPLAWFHRQFHLQAVKIAIAAGITQFIDLGSGLPETPNVHEMAQKFTRMVAVDYDPVVFAHCNAAFVDTSGVSAVLADIRDTDHVISQLRGLIDFSQPVAVLAAGVLHYVMDDERPADIISRFRTEMAPGSVLVLTHWGIESDPDLITQVGKSTACSTAQTMFRAAAEITGWLNGFTIRPPGIAPIQDWLEGDLPETQLQILGGICRVP